MSDIVERLREVQCEWEHDAATCGEAADEIIRLLNIIADTRTENMRLRAQNAELLEALADPVKVHINMLAGVIAKPSLAQIIHLYGEGDIRAAIAKAGETNDR